MSTNRGERGVALGNLSQEVVARTVKVTVLAWTGKSSPFNNCPHPRVYYQTLDSLHIPSITQGDMETCVVRPQGQNKALQSNPPSAISQFHLSSSPSESARPITFRVPKLTAF